MADDFFWAIPSNETRDVNNNITATTAEKIDMVFCFIVCFSFFVDG